MGKSSFPPGFRFSPTDVELVKYYLKRKVMGRRLRIEVIAEVDIYKYDPWDLPDKSCWHYGDLKWYFFCPREKKYASGARMNRATERGYWKATGKDRSVHYNGEVVGWIKTLIFHTGRPPKGERTNWVCHEYRVEDKGLADMGVPQDSYVLCIIFQKEGPGPRNGAQYGAPFNEEDWTDDEAEICLDAVLHASRPELDHVMPNNCNSSTTSGAVSTGAICIGPSSESCVSVAVPPPCNVLQSVSRNYVSIEERNHSSNDDILSLFDCLFEESANENDKIKEPDSFLNQKGESNSCIHSGNSNVTQEVGNVIHSGNASSAQEVNNLIHVGIQNTTQESDGIIQSENVAAPAYPNRSDIYKDLEDLGNLGRVANEYDLSSGNSSLYTMDDIFELADLDKPLN